MGARLRIGTRGSALALAQADLIAGLLAAGNPEREIDLEVIAVSGDGTHSYRGSGSAHGTATDKRRWVDAIEGALMSGTIDLAVHSAKDLPGALPEGLALLGAPGRAPAQDALCGAQSIESLPAGARIGTSSLRREAQLRAARPDLEVVSISGNVDTRLGKLAAGEWDAIVLARAGLQRLGRESELGAVLDQERFVPAPGQGTLALEGRIDDERAGEAAASITDHESLACLLAERALARALEADCHTPLGAHAEPAGCGCLQMRAWVGLPDGSEWVQDELLGGFYDPEELGRRMAARMSTAGASDLLRRAGEMALVGEA